MCGGSEDMGTLYTFLSICCEPKTNRPPTTKKVLKIRVGLFVRTGISVSSQKGRIPGQGEQLARVMDKIHSFRHLANLSWLTRT